MHISEIGRHGQEGGRRSCSISSVAGGHGERCQGVGRAESVNGAKSPTGSEIINGPTGLEMRCGSLASVPKRVHSDGQRFPVLCVAPSPLRFVLHLPFPHLSQASRKLVCGTSESARPTIGAQRALNSIVRLRNKATRAFVLRHTGTACGELALDAAEQLSARRLGLGRLGSVRS